jgi:next-to-BRCA1 protein 1
MQIPVNGVPIDGELDVAADFVSPALPGRYISYWRMAYPSGGKFGQRVWVLIEVLAFLVLPSLALLGPFHYTRTHQKVHSSYSLFFHAG